MNNDYYRKYLKYKIKYTKLQNQIGSGKTPYTGPLTPCCTPYSTILIKAHGRMIDDPFILPKGVNIITLTPIGDSCALSARVDEELRAFYEAGNTLFKDNDKSPLLTDEGYRFEQKLRSTDFNYVLKNHIGDGIIKMNNQILRFTGIGCNNHETSLCSIDCIAGTHKNSIGEDEDLKQKLDCHYSDRTEKPIDTMTLKEIIYREVWPKTFICNACRSFSTDITPKNIKLMRQISENSNKK